MSGRIGRLADWVLDRRHAAPAVALTRILLALSVLGLLVSNFSTRDVWVGQGAVWADPARSVSRFPELVLLDGVSPDILTLVYVLTALAATSLLLGWHAKAATVLTFVGFIAIVGQNPVVGTQGDDVVRIALLWMLLMRTSEHWSLDARRRTRIAIGVVTPGPRDQEVLPRWLATSLHNIGLLGLAGQTILLQTAGGVDKISHAVWRDGTALYYPMQLPDLRPFPGLSDALSTSALVVAVLTYAVLASQLLFAPLLLRAGTRRAVVIVAIVVDLVLGVVLGTLWATLATVAVISLFLADDDLFGIEDRVARVADPAVDWLVERWYAVVDRLYDLRHRWVLPHVDRLRDTVRRR